MNTDDRTVAFINSLDKGNSLFLYELEKYAHATGVPIIRTQTQSLLRFLLTVKKPSRMTEPRLYLLHPTGAPSPRLSLMVS